VGYDRQLAGQGSMRLMLVVHFVGYCACVWVASSHITTTVGVLRYPIVFAQFELQFLSLLKFV
jgi:hypothetical protein